MAPKPKKAISDTLENLSEINFKKFTSALLGRKAEPRVKTRQVEKKDFLDITDLLVSTFTESGALAVTRELLIDIGCNNDAESLDRALFPNPALDDTKPPAAPDGEHFVDKYRRELIQKVATIGPILDELLYHKVISQEAYDDIRVLKTNQDKMREIYTSALQAGPAAKNIFYQALKKHNPALIEHLETNV